MDDLGTWTAEPTPHRAEPFTAYAADAGGLARLHEDVAGRSLLTADTAYLDVLIRFGHSDIEGLRAAVGKGPIPDFYSAVRAPYLLYQWVRTGNPRRDDRPPDEGLRANVAKGKFSGRAHPVAHTHRLTDRLIEETIGRLGTVNELLSTPTHSDGTIRVGVLAERVRRSQGIAHGPYDLVQALLRLGGFATEDAELFDGPRGSAAEVIRSWILAGGLPLRQVLMVKGEPVTTAVTLPLPAELAGLEGLAGIAGGCPGMGPIEAMRMADPGSWLGVSPWDAEQLGALLAQRVDLVGTRDAAVMEPIASSPGYFGVAMHHHFARMLAHPVRGSRTGCAEMVATVARQGRLDPSMLRDRSLELFEAGELPLARTADSWVEVARRSSWALVWPTWVAVLDAACRRDRTPAGLSDLLRMTRERVPLAERGAPTDPLPESVKLLGDRRGRSVALQEARALGQEVAQIAADRQLV